MTIQSDVYVIILITIVLAIAMILLSKKIEKADPLEKPNKTKPEKKRDPIIHDLEHQISVKLGTKVTIQNKKLTIRYTDTEDLNRILEILNCLDEG